MINVALLGGVIFLLNRRWSEWLTKHSVPFAAGVLVTVAIAGLMPEAVEVAGEEVFWWVLGAFLVAFGFEQVLWGLHHHFGEDHNEIHHSSVALVIVGDTIHNFIDGVAIAASFIIHPGLGLITAVSTFLHEVPHEIGDFGIMLKAGWRRTRVFWVNVLSASTTFLGAGFVLLFSEQIELQGRLLAVAAGLFLYLGASDFLPQITERKEERRRMAMALFLGVLIMTGVFLAVPHGEEERVGQESLEDQVEF
ncbi:MAG: ZIP family metal transporter [Candidatus Chisholmbacteria bacterium]|nr:ZIP family metal transporter [Candidatus Chisholmbacteria bacterium]